ncbi:MAG: hypothetical protein O3A47_12095 [Chloroflexi bacterium]|nr:hypothetical protein [Chloroflexota bacterium]
MRLEVVDAESWDDIETLLTHCPNTRCPVGQVSIDLATAGNEA